MSEEVGSPQTFPTMCGGSEEEPPGSKHTASTFAVQGFLSRTWISGQTMSVSQTDMLIVP